MPAYVNLGSYLKQKRIEAGYSQIELGKMFGYSSSQFISNWERGLAAPPEENLQQLIKLLKLRLQAVVFAMIEDYRVEVENKVFGKKRRAQ